LPTPAANDPGEPQSEDLKLPAQEEPIFRLVFRDQAGALHTSTYRTTWHPRLGRRHAEARKRAIYDACRVWHETLGMELISMNLIRVHETSIL